LWEVGVWAEEAAAMEAEEGEDMGVAAVEEGLVEAGLEVDGSDRSLTRTMLARLAVEREAEVTAVVTVAVEPVVAVDLVVAEKAVV
jgi:hypothetical protein